MQEVQSTMTPASPRADALETPLALPPGLADGQFPATPGSTVDAPLPAPGSLPSFPCLPGETPRAFSAFRAFFALGHGRSLPDVAAQLDEKLSTVKQWSSRFRWSARIQSFNSGLLQQQAEAEAALRASQAADWARRNSDHREQEWAAVQKLLGAVQCFLDSFGDREVEKMTLGQVSRAFQISSAIAHEVLRDPAAPESPGLAPIQLELLAALVRTYAVPLPSSLSSTPTGVGPAIPPPLAATGS